MSYYNLTFRNLSPLGVKQLPIIRVDPGEARAPRRAVEALQQGQVVVFPTDTLYGLGCRIDDDASVRRIFEIKGRPLSEAMPVLLADPAQLEHCARSVTAAARRLTRRFWPGPLTLVFLRSDSISPLVAGGGDTVALRVPNHPVPRALARAIGVPIVGTSANSHGMPAPLTAQQVVYDLGDRVDLVLDGGRVPLGRPSTVVDVTTEMPRLVREGVIPADQLRDYGVRGLGELIPLVGERNPR